MNLAAGARANDSIMFGALCVMGSMLFIAGMDGFAKYLSQHYPVMQVTWARYVFHFAILVPIVWIRYGAAAFLPPRLGLQLLRSVFMVAATVLFFFGLSHMPIAETLALAFIAPLVVTALAPFLLGERVGIRRYAAVAVGFLGTLFIIKPGTDVFQWVAIFGLGAGAVYALYIVATRQLAGTAPPLVTLAYSALVGTVVTTLALPAVWLTPTWPDLAAMIAMGALAACGHFLVIIGYERAQASAVAPYGYTELIWATAIGYFGFGDLPDGWAWLGMAIICASGIYISMRELRLAATLSKS